MAEYDAFGRKVGEGATTPEPAPTPTSTPTPHTPSEASLPGVPTEDATPTATPTPASPAQPKLKLSGVPSRSGGGFSFAWVGVLIMVAVMVAFQAELGWRRARALGARTSSSKATVAR